MTAQTISSRSYGGAADLPAIAELINACDAVDQVNEGTTLEDLREEFATPGVDIARDVRLWLEDDTLLAFGQVWFHAEAADPDGFLWYQVHPRVRDTDLDEQVLAWGMERTREAARERGRQLKFRVQAHASEPERMALLERHGFGADRYFHRMVRPLGAPLPEMQLPAGFRLTTGPQDPAAWAAMFNESFVDHWNHEPWSAEQVRHWQIEPSYRADIDLVAVAPDGTLAAFCWGGLEQQTGAPGGPAEGRIGLLGTRRGFREIGLGRAMLLAGLHALQAAGAPSVWLSVDADSPTGATRLYESAGFATRLTRILYRKELDD